MKEIMRKLTLASVFVFVGTTTCLSAEYVFLPGATDFSLGSSYQGSPATPPGSNDDILLPANTTIAIDASTASFAAFANCRRVIPQMGSVVTITVVEEDKAEMSAAFSSYGREGGGYKIGEIVKKGGGELWLAADGLVVQDGAAADYYDYWTALTVEAGTLYMPQYCTGNQIYYGWVTVSENATLYTTSAKVNSTAWTRVRKLIGTGTVKNQRTSSTCTRSGHSLTVLRTTDPDEVTCFEGKILAPVTSYNNGADYTLAGTGSTASIMLTSGDGLYPAAGARCVTRIGSMAVGGAGSTVSFTGSNGALVNVGTSDETADLPISFNGTSSSAACIDFGVHGGLNITGPWSQAVLDYVRNVYLYGDSEKECVFNNSMSETGETSVLGFVKRGTGIVRFGMGNVQNRAFGGSVAIEDGTVRFDSIEEAGALCSLGRADKLAGTAAYVLGGEDKDPVFEYTGSFDAFCSTRPLALVYGGGHLRNSTDANLTFVGVSARDAGSSPTLVLDGANTTGESVVREISDGATGAKVNVTKEGSGTWKIGGNLTFSGKVKVSGGTLAIAEQNRTPAIQDYKWFRLSFAHIAGNARNTMNIRQIGLYDVDGVRQNVGLTPVCGSAPQNEKHEVYVATEVPAGCVAWDASMTGRYINTGNVNGIGDSFREDGYSGNYGKVDLSLYRSESATTINEFDLNDPTTWIRIVMHLKDDAKPIHHFDVQAMAKYWSNLPTRLKLEASLDGEEWNEVWGNVEAGEELTGTFANYNCWLSNPQKTDKSHPEGTGWNLAASSGRPHDEFTWFRLSVAQIGPSVGVSNELRIREICLFDVDGVRQNARMTVKRDGDPVAGLQAVYVPARVEPGEAAFGSAASGLWMDLMRPSGNEIGLGECFSDVFASQSWANNSHTLQLAWLTADKAPLAPIPADRSTWIPIVMRLSEKANRVTHFDIQLFNNLGQKTCWPSRILLEGSRDGETWETVFNNATQGDAFDLDRCGKSSGYGAQEANKWLSDGKAVNDATETDNYHKRVFGEGFALIRTGIAYDDNTYSQFENVSSVQVENGGVLSTSESRTIKGLTIDITKPAGTIEGFAFAATGMVDVLGDGADDVLPIVFENCAGIENLANWSVRVNGKLKGGRKIVVKDGRLFILKPGLTIVIR